MSGAGDGVKREAAGVGASGDGPCDGWGRFGKVMDLEQMLAWVKA